MAWFVEATLEPSWQSSGVSQRELWEVEYELVEIDENRVTFYPNN
jgi:hypothetical protein